MTSVSSGLLQGRVVYSW